MWCRLVQSDSAYSCSVYDFLFFFFCKQKTAYEMRISDWSSDVCSSDLRRPSVHAMRTELDATDRRLMAIDDHLATPNHELAREIDALREIGRASCRERVCQYV